MKLKTIYSVFALLILFSLSFDTFCQDRTYFYGTNHKPIDSEEGARFSKKIFIKNKKTTIVESYAKIDEQWELTQTERIKKTNESNQYINIKPVSGDSYSIHRKFKKTDNEYFEFADYLNEKLIRVGRTSQLLPLCLQDTVKEFYIEGQLKTVAFYENNQLKCNENWLKDGSKYCDNIFYAVDKEPMYLLGQQQFNNFILANLMNQQVDLTQYTEKIVLGWVIDDSGKMQGVHTAKTMYPGLSDLLIEIVKEMPSDWRPATLNGENVNYYMQFPINFKSHKEDGFESLELVNGVLSWD